MPGKVGFFLFTWRLEYLKSTSSDESRFTAVEMFPSCDEQTKNDIIVSASSGTEFSSPLQVTPLFRTLAAGIPSPKFSESVSQLCSSILPTINPSVLIASMYAISSRTNCQFKDHASSLIWLSCQSSPLGYADG